MDDLIVQLLKIDSEADWTVPEVEAPDGAERHFKRYLGQVLAMLRERSGADQAYVAVSSVACGYFTPFVAVGRSVEAIPRTPTYGDASGLTEYLAKDGLFQVIAAPQSGRTGRDFDGVGQRVLIKLLGHGELFGFICLDCREPGTFAQPALDELRRFAPMLISQIAEENFSMRVRQLAGPFTPGDDRALYEEIIERTARGFAVDGAALRIYYPEYDVLTVEAHRGDIPRYLLRDRPPGEPVCGTVLTDPTHSWAAVHLHQATQGSGVSLSEAATAHLREAGIQALLVMRLESDVIDAGQDKRIGTLSYFLRRPHRFSWRDVALFRSFCQRVSDTIALQRQTAKLRENYEVLQEQSTMLTRVEIVSLIAHDLFHKSFNTCLAVRDYIEKSRKALNNKAQTRTHAHLEDDAKRAQDTAEAVQRSLEQLRSLQQTNTQEFEKESTFGLHQLFDEIEKTLNGALRRNKVSIRRDFPDGVTITGARSVLNHVFFNLIINSIDAARSRSSTRPMAIHVQARVEQRRLVIHFWDEGPGINRAVFRDPSQVFEIGKTTKRTGTGTGLPVARTLLGRYFKGNLTLEEPETARFKITIPLP